MLVRGGRGSQHVGVEIETSCGRGGKMDRGVEVLSQGGREFQFKGAGEVGGTIRPAFFPRACGGAKTRMSSAARLQIAEPLPPVHAVELGFVPEGLQHSLVAATPP